MKLLHNAKIHTFNATQPSASAILIDRERIIAVGMADEILSAYPFAEKEDMNGRMILPGLTDAHIHLQHYALALQKIECETDTKAECLRRVAERVKRAKPGEWILGHGWNQNTWKSWPTAAELDSIAPDNPVYLTAKSLHAGVINTAAMKFANVNNKTADPQNGALQRDQGGNITGVLLETAMALASSAVPDTTLTEIMVAMEKAQPILWKMGITGIHDFDRRDSFMSLQMLHSQNKLKLRVLKNIPVELLDQAFELGLRGGFGDDMLRIGNIKVFMDGALGPHTAAMFQPYQNEEDNRGILNMDGEELFEHGRKAAQVGLGMTVHAIGDRANHEVLNAYEQLRNFENDHHLSNMRHRVEHVQILHPDDLNRLGKMNIVASMQPIHAISDMQMADDFWGDRAKYSYAWRTQLDHGARLAFGSDAPVDSPNPFLGLHASVTRRRPDGSPSTDGWYPEQKLTMFEAWNAYTSGAAYAAYMEDRLGRLAPGFLADIVVLNNDPFTCDPDELLTMASSATMVNGEWVYRSE